MHSHDLILTTQPLRYMCPQEAYTDLWASLTASRSNAGAGERLTPKKALKKLEQRFSSSTTTPTASSKAASSSSSSSSLSEPSPVVVLLADELDYLVTSNQMVRGTLSVHFHYGKRLELALSLTLALLHSASYMCAGPLQLVRLALPPWGSLSSGGGRQHHGPARAARRQDAVSLGLRAHRVPKLHPPTGR